MTDTTKKRIANIPTDIEYKELTLSEKDGETGIIFFNDNLHCAYCITKTGVYLLASNKKDVENDFHKPGVFYNNRNRSSYAIEGLTTGFIYIDMIEGTLKYWINNVMDSVMQSSQENNILRDKSILKKLKKLMRLIEDKKDNYDSLLEMLQNDPSLKKHHDYYAQQFNELKLCLQSFLFIHFADVMNVTRISERLEPSIKQKLEGKKGKAIDVIRVDTLYDTTIDVINPFMVTGHFRRQPYGKERKERKLIYIDAFMKSGYHRDATKLKVEKNGK